MSCIILGWELRNEDFRCFALANKTCTTCKRIMCVHGWCVGLMNFHENKEIHHRAFVGIVRVEVNLYRARSFYHLTNPTATPTRPLFSSFLTKPVYSREKKGRKTLLASICFLFGCRPQESTPFDPSFKPIFRQSSYPHTRSVQFSIGGSNTSGRK